MFCETRGTGDPLVFCDGLLCDGHIWKYLFADIESDYRIIHWHYPGHGRSDEPPSFAELSPRRLADDVSEIVDDLGCGPVTMVGHSMGVQVCLETWRRHRDKVRRIVLVCGSPGKLVQHFHEGPLLEFVVPILGLVGDFVPDLVSEAWKKVPAAPLSRLVMYTGEINSRLLRAPDMVPYFAGLSRVDFRLAVKMLSAAGRHDATGFLHEIDVETLVIAGEKDRFTPPFRSVTMAESIGQAELKMVPGGTHALPLEQPELVSLQIRRFLERS